MTTMINTAGVRPPPNNAPLGREPRTPSMSILLKTLTSLRHAQKGQELSQLLNDKKVVDQLGKALMFYRREDNVDKMKQAVADIQLKFTTKESEVVTNRVKELILLPFMQSVSLNADIAFEVLDRYLAMHHQKYIWFKMLENRLEDMQKQLQIDQGQRLQGFMLQEPQVTQEKCDRFNKELEQSAHDIIAGVKDYYFGERQSLLACLLFIVNEAQNQSEFAALFRDCFENSLCNKELPLSLLQSLVRSLEVDKEFEYFDLGRVGQENHQPALINHLQVELISILKILFVIYYKPWKKPKTDECLLMIEYINESNGRYSRSLLNRLGNQQQQLVNQEIIKSLSLLTALAMHLGDQAKPAIITPQDKEIWEIIVDPGKLTPHNSPLVLAVICRACGPPTENNREVGDRERVIYRKLSEGDREGTSLVEVSTLLQSEAFRVDDLRQMYGAFSTVLFRWLNLAFDVFKALRKDDEQRYVKDLSMRVLKNEEIVKVIWHQIGQGAREGVFEQILNKPTDDLQSFFELAVALCGKHYYPHGTKMLAFLEHAKVEGESNLLMETIYQCTTLVSRLERQTLTTTVEIAELFQALMLVAKIIKQDPIQYRRMNGIYREIAEDHQQKNPQMHFHRRSKSRYSNASPLARQPTFDDADYDIGEHPFLSLLIRALHSLFDTQFDLNPRQPIIHLMDAISEIYDSSLEMRREIIDQIERYRDQAENSVMLIPKFLSMTQHEQSTLRNYKATESFLRFLCKIFKRTYPQECLDREKDFMDSFLAQALYGFYKLVLEHYQELKFVDAASMGTFTARLLKLTRTLLDHFTEIPQSQKAPLLQPMPRFDLLLAAISDILNQVPVEQLCREPLVIVPVKDHSNFGLNQLTRLENKFLNDAIYSGSSSQNQCIKLAKMIAQALATLNKLVQLALTEDIADASSYVGQQNQWTSNMTLHGQNQNLNLSQDWTSKKLVYIRGLSCVRWMRQQMISPNKTQNMHSGSQFGSVMSYSFLSQLAHYISPSDQLDVESVKYPALRLLIQVCKLWQQQPSDQPDLFHLLQELNSTQQIQQNLLRQLVGALEHGNRDLGICVAFVDLLIYAANSQHNFLEMLLLLNQSNKPQLATLCDAILAQISDNSAPENALDVARKLQLRLKLVVLISIVAQKRICIDFVSYNDHAFAKAMMHHVIEGVCFQQILKGATVDFDGGYLEPFHETDPDCERKETEYRTKSRIAVELCQCKVAVTYFLELLTSEFSRDPTQKPIRELIQRVQSQEGLKAISLTQGQISHKVFDLINTVAYVNHTVLNNESDRDINLQGRYHQYLCGHDWANIAEQQDSPMFSQSGSVQLNGLLCVDLFKNLQNKPRYQFIIGEHDSLNSWRDVGNFGCEFFISTRELEFTMKQEQYHNDLNTEQIKILCNEFNLALSSMLADYHMLKAKHEFQVSVGRITLKDNQPTVKNELQIPSSFIPLVSKEQVRPASEAQMAESTSKILRLMIQQARHLYKELKQRQDAYQKVVNQAAQRGSQMAPKNFLLIKLDETVLSSLIFSLGVITSQLSNTLGIPVDVKGDLEALIKNGVLLKMDKLVELDSSFMSDGDMVIEQSTKIRTQLQATEKQKFEIYTQLANQCFQICSLLKDDDERVIPIAQRNLPQIDMHQQETAYIKVLSTVVEGMRRNHCFEKGLQVLNIAVPLIDNDNLQNFMRKQDHQPLRVIIGRLNDNDSTAKEVSEILQLLISYAQTPNGAVHLSNIKILDCLSQSNIMQQVNNEDLYTTHSSSGKHHQVRNPVHILWCQVLLLLRTLNEELLENPSVEHQEYFDDLVRLLHNFKQRFTSVLHIGIQIESSRGDIQSNQLLTLALLEEIDIMCSLFQQMFEHADLWKAHDDYMYCEMKDYMLFSVSKLLQFCDTRTIIPASVTEEHLKTISQSSIQGSSAELLGQDIQAQTEMSGLELKSELCLQNIFLTASCSILNCLLLSKKMKQRGNLQYNEDLLATWHEPTVWNDQNRGVNMNNSQTSIFAQNYLASHAHADEPVIRIAFHVYSACQNRMVQRHSTLKTLFDEQKIEALYNYERSLFQHDDWIKREFVGGFHSYMFTHTGGMRGALEQSEVTLQVSGNVGCLLLEKVRETIADQRYFGGFEANFQNDKDIATMARKLEEDLKETDTLLKDQGIQAQTSSDNVLSNQGKSEGDVGGRSQRLDEDYMKKMMAFSRLVQERPQKQAQNYFD